MKKRIFSLYSWGTVIIWYAFIHYTSIIVGSEYITNTSNNYFNFISFQLSYGVLFLLIFRSILNELRLKVTRLMYYKSKRELSEDIEFAHIVEYLTFFISISLSVLAVVFNEYLQITRKIKIASTNDLLSNIVGIMLFAALTFVLPHIHEFEIILTKKINNKYNNMKKVKSSKVSK